MHGGFHNNICLLSQPNCYSRAITVNGDEHIIIFSKRDIDPWEELTYDYRSGIIKPLTLIIYIFLQNQVDAFFRFFSSDQRLPCYCGFPKCRGVVNDVEAEEQAAKIRIKRSELFRKTDN